MDPSDRIWVERRLRRIPPNGNAGLYLVAIVIMVAIALTAITLIVVLRPTVDNAPLITLIIGLIAPSTMSLLTLLKAHETHRSVNGRLEEFMDSTRHAARAEGLLEGHKQANEEHAPIVATMADIHRAITEHDAWERDRLAKLDAPPVA